MLDSVDDLIAKISSCQHDGFVTSHLQEIFGQLGISAFVFVTMLVDSNDKDVFRYHLGCDPNWFNIYNQRRWHTFDPFIRYAKFNSKPILISELEIEETETKRDFVENNLKYGFSSGMIIPAHSGSNGRMGVLIVGNGLDGVDGNEGLNRNKIRIRGIANELLDWWIDRLQNTMVDKDKLKPDHMRILKLVYAQNNTKEIALTLGLTESQVNNRIREFNEIFKVSNKKQAASIAMEFGIIKPY